jgi:hypothetical protein
VGGPGHEVLPGSPSCLETRTIVEVDDATGSTSTSLVSVATRSRQAIVVTPRHAAVLLFDELAALDEGDTEGVREVVSAIAELLVADA